MTTKAHCQCKNAEAPWPSDAVASERTLLLGLSERMRVLLVVHVELDAATIRLISARRATAHERRRYEEGQ